MRRHLGFSLVAGAIILAAGCASHGREVFLREGCINCHRFGDLGSGGAVDLTEIGSRRDAAWIGVQLCNPAAHNPASRMPPFPHITGFDLRSLIAFLRG